jgi:hypothetical protein
VYSLTILNHIVLTKFAITSGEISQLPFHVNQGELMIQDAENANKRPKGLALS